MDGHHSIQVAVRAFRALSEDERLFLQSYADGIPRDALEHSFVYDFSKFMYDKKLVIVFDWTGWQEGRDWYSLQDGSKYDSLDIATGLKLVTAVIRNDRFCEGALFEAFESGVFPKILQKLITI